MLYGIIAIGLAYGMKALQGPVTQVSFVPWLCYTIVLQHERLARTSYPDEFCPIVVLQGMKDLQGPVTR